MPGPQVDALVEQILRALPTVDGIDSAITIVQDELSLFNPRIREDLAAEFSEARQIVSAQFEQIEILHNHSVIEKRPPWYFGPKPGDFHWPALRKYLQGQGWSEDNVDNLDRDSSEVVSLLENPNKQSFSGRGLVVGHVQSGKTANMTAVIAKALDAGYDTIIVLAGLTNKLRYQTQMRMFRDLVNRDPLRWQVLTPNNIDDDFRTPAQGGFLHHNNRAQLAVVKKNTSPLRQLRTAIGRTLPAILNSLRILIIDDECDQASVNSAQNELNVSAINEHIREIIASLPAATYVGYTATPFANVLINPYKEDNQTLDDLYPKDFITALSPPPNYFGTRQLFGVVPADPANPLEEEEGLDMIREVPSDDASLLQAPSREERESFRPSMAPSLVDALLYYFACCAARRARGDTDKHMTMLIHTSAYVSEHQHMADLIQGWVESNRQQIVDRTSEVGKRLAKRWRDEQGVLPEDITGARTVTISEIFEQLPQVLRLMEFPIENGASDDRIDYENGTRIYVVVGGTILARGLTLEGLMVSYFLRSTNQYDTLLQMGRWFGYRTNYEDLPRIWMPEDLRLRFRALASIEQEIREDIDQYRVQELTPMQLAVRIRAIPGMAITAANKMRSHRRCAVSYWGTHRQTFHFNYRDATLLQSNWTAAANLVDLAEGLGLRDNDAANRDTKLWKEVPKHLIERFFDSYQVHPTHIDLAPEMLIDFIRSSDPRLEKWNVAIIEPDGGIDSDLELGSVGKVRLNSRAPLDDDAQYADIKALMSRRDILIDCDESVSRDGGWLEVKERRLQNVGQIPLLLLYPIDKSSKPRSYRHRTDLNAPFDLMGYGIIFPGSPTEGGHFVSVNLKPLSADEIDEIEEEERAQAEAAGV